MSFRKILSAKFIGIIYINKMRLDQRLIYLNSYSKKIPMNEFLLNKHYPMSTLATSNNKKIILIEWKVMPNKCNIRKICQFPLKKKNQLYYHSSNVVAIKSYLKSKWRNIKQISYHKLKFLNLDLVNATPGCRLRIIYKV